MRVWGQFIQITEVPLGKYYTKGTLPSHISLYVHALAVMHPLRLRHACRGGTNSPAHFAKASSAQPLTAREAYRRALRWAKLIATTLVLLERPTIFQAVRPINYAFCE